MPTLARAATAETGAEGSSRKTDRAASRMPASLRAASRRRPLSGASVSRMSQGYHWNGMIRSAIVELFIPFQRGEGLVIEPFTASVAEADLADLRRRLAATRWAPEQPAGAEDGAYGVPLTRLRRLVARWEEFDWRDWEGRLNAYPQFLTRIDGQPVHFLHVRSAVPGAFPVVLSHGWPGSVFEYLDLVGRLADPAAHGAGPADAFHVVLPSLPGYGFSGPALKPGWGTRRIAAALAELMALLGYERYGAIGNDAGSMIAPELARQQPGRVAGVHVTQLFSFPSGDPAELAGLDADEQAAMSVLQWFWQHKGAFNVLQGQQPQTLAHALADSPAGPLP